MKHPDHLPMRSLLLACCLAAAYPAAHAEESSTTSATTETTSPSTTTTAVGTSTNTETRLSTEFAGFLGGKEQAHAVVSGLRQGTAFSLESATGTTDTSTSSTTIDPPTGSMGYGSVRITLRLAQAELNELGITQPTTDELSAALLGGTINGTQVDGILTMRADGMGWGVIAQKYGMTVGQIMGKGGGLTKQAATATHTGQTKTTGKAGSVSVSATRPGQIAHPHGNGYIPSSSRAASATQAHSNGYIASGGGKASGAGIVSAAGGNLSGSAHGAGKGQAYKATTGTQGGGAVSAGGRNVSLSTASNAGGGSNAMAPGQARKN